MSKLKLFMITAAAVNLFNTAYSVDPVGVASIARGDGRAQMGGDSKSRTPFFIAAFNKANSPKEVLEILARFNKAIFHAAYYRIGEINPAEGASLPAVVAETSDVSIAAANNTIANIELQPTTAANVAAPATTAANIAAPANGLSGVGR